jgi:hypothetical protein
MNVALLLAAVLAAAADPRAPGAVVRVHELARLTPAEAERLHGRRALFGLTLDSLPGEHNGCTL